MPQIVSASLACLVLPPLILGPQGRGGAGRRRPHEHRVPPAPPSLQPAQCLSVHSRPTVPHCQTHVLSSLLSSCRSENCHLLLRAAAFSHERRRARESRSRLAPLLGSGPVAPLPRVCLPLRLRVPDGARASVPRTCSRTGRTGQPVPRTHMRGSKLKPGPRVVTLGP